MLGQALLAPALFFPLLTPIPSSSMSPPITPDTFFQHVELCLLLQSFYVAIWATQLIPLAVSNHSSGWGVAFTIPMVLNYFVIRLVREGQGQG